MDVFILHFSGLPVSYILLCTITYLPSYHRFTPSLSAYLLYYSWLLRHVGFLCLACLAKFGSFLALQITNFVLFIIVLGNYFTYA